MELSGNAKLLRIFIAETDKAGHSPLYEIIVRKAHEGGLAGATVLRAIMGFGPTSRIRTSKILDLSSDLPVVVEIVDDDSKIQEFLPCLQDLFEKSGCGGLITLENAEIIRYVHAGSQP